MPEDDTKKAILSGDDKNAGNEARKPIEVPVPVEKKPAPAPGLAAPDAHKPTLDLSEIAAMISGHKPQTPDEREAEAKRERREKLFSAIGDSVSALTNLYFAGKTGYSNYNPAMSMSARAQQRWDRIEKERQANLGRFNDAYWKIRNNMDQQQRWRDQLGLEEARMKAQEEARKQSAAIAKAESDAKVRYYDEQARTQQSQQRYNEARAGYYDRSPGAGTSTRKSSGSSRSKYTLTIGGKTNSYASQTDYNRAVEGLARQYGIDTDTIVTSTDKDGRKSSRPRRKSIAELAAEVEAAAMGGNQTTNGRNGAPSGYKATKRTPLQD